MTFTWISFSLLLWHFLSKWSLWMVFAGTQVASVGILRLDFSVYANAGNTLDNGSCCGTILA
eukprot:m.189967 g.189967  ORF g.189967 m.189967 type:complete len:62 (+) comp39428_c0_seq5:227-412(+)